jgi:hypothetical protein
MRRAPNMQIGNTRRPLRRVLRDRNPLTATPKTLILRREVASTTLADFERRGIPKSVFL